MPLIAVYTGRKLAAETKRNIASELGKIVTVIPGKNEGNLMVAVQDGLDMVFAGDASGDCLYADIKLHGASPHEAKDKLVTDCIAMLHAAAGVPTDNIYVTVAEFANWGAIGKYL